MNKTCLLIINGKFSSRSLLKKLLLKYDSDIICADGGSNIAFKLGVIPKYIIGDLDSISDEALKYYEGKTSIKKISRQTDTDLEKALKFIVKKNYSRVIVFGASGGRFDHQFANTSILFRYAKLIEITFIAEETVGQFIRGDKKFNSRKGEAISIFAFDAKTRITSKGLKYKLKETKLKYGEREGNSNESLGENFSLKVVGGICLIIRSLNSFLSDE